jgi:hypothetical protein
MSSDNAPETEARLRAGEERRRGHSGEGSDSVLRLIRSRRLAQFRETAADPHDSRSAEPGEEFD